MNTTQIGKWLVFINVTLSLIFLAGALGLYTNHVNWATPPSDGGQRVQGMVDELKAEIQTLVAAREAAEDGWHKGGQLVRALEGERPRRQEYYAALLRSVRQGDVADIKPPVQQLEFAQSGALVLKRN